MVVTTSNDKSLTADLEDVLESVKRYTICLNRAKFSFGVEECKFIGFILNKRWIKETPYNFYGIINMRISSNIK